MEDFSSCGALKEGANWWHSCGTQTLDIHFELAAESVNHIE